MSQKCVAIRSLFFKKLASHRPHNISAVQSKVSFAETTLQKGGTNHINLQWPEWWAEKFARHGYAACDVVRWRLWQDERISFWYRQNMLLFVGGGQPGLLAGLRSVPLSEVLPERPLPVVHPGMLIGLSDPRPSARQLLAALPGALYRAVRWRVGAGVRSLVGKRA